MHRPRTDLSGRVGTHTDKGTLITQAKADAVARDNEYLEVVEDNSQMVIEAIPRAIARALEKIGILAEGHVIGYITQHHIVDTGRLRNSITHAVTGEDSVIVGTNVEYAIDVHEGTSRMKGRPYLTSPVQAHQKEYEDILKDELQGS